MIAMNLAIDLQRRGYAIAVIDADPTSRTALIWADDRIREGFPQVPVKTEGDNLLRTLKETRASYDHVILDTAPGASDQLVTGLGLSELLVVPTSGDKVDLDALEPLSLMLKRAWHSNPRLSVLAVLNQVLLQGAGQEIHDAKMSLELYPDFLLAETVMMRDGIWNDLRISGRGVVEKDGTVGNSMRTLASEIFAAAGEDLPERRPSRTF